MRRYNNHQEIEYSEEGSENEVESWEKGNCENCGQKPQGPRGRAQNFFER